METTSEGRGLPSSDHRVDIAKAVGVWFRDARSTAVFAQDLFSTRIPTPDGRHVIVPTHFKPDQEINLIAYDDALGASQEDIARYFEAGEVFICVKHHKPGRRSLEAAGKEAVKFDASHVSVGVGVEVPDGDGDKHRGAVTINNPQDYGADHGEDDGRGLFGSTEYPMIFLRLKFPSDVTPRQRSMYMDNIRTWLIITNAVTNFPADDYNGGDPLGTLSVKSIRLLGDKLLVAQFGTFEEKGPARRWLDEPANQIYCSELAHVAVNLGVHYPLNRAMLGERYPAVREAVESKAFVERNKNPYARLADLTMAPDALTPIMELLRKEPTEPGPRRPFGEGLAYRPMTMTDMVREYVQLIPRNEWGEEASAPMQAKLFRDIRLGLIEQMALNELAWEDSERRARRQAVERLLDGIEAHLAKPAASYAAFQQGLQPYLREAEQMAGPRPDGSGVFMPPHCWLLHALDRLPREGSLMEVELVGHGLHASVLKHR